MELSNGKIGGGRVTTEALKMLERPSRRIALLVGLGVFIYLAFCGGSSLGWPFPQTPSEPWTPAQTVHPYELVRELANPRNANRPIVVCVGFRPLFEGAHVPGAVFHGAASTSGGMEDLKKWAQGLRRDADVVIYCGCCPMSHCPNVRPAFEALKMIGFRHLRVLVLPNDFATDWVAKGYPAEKGRQSNSPGLASM